MRLVPILAAAACFFACKYVALDFSRPLSPNEVVLEQEIRSLYTELAGAFATGNVDGMTMLFSPSITHPMSQSQIRAWAQDFFGRNAHARFHILSFSFDQLSYTQSVVTLKYRVETPNGRDDFGGTETDTLVQRQGRWYIASWDKVSEAAPAAGTSKR